MGSGPEVLVIGAEAWSIRTFLVLCSLKAEYFGTIPPSITATPQTFPFYIHIRTDHAFFGVEKVVGAPELPNFGPFERF
jgi:hypothetical protein